jgi:hypothetical protein
LFHQLGRGRDHGIAKVAVMVGVNLTVHEIYVDTVYFECQS